jgi:hypothetical protein
MRYYDIRCNRYYPQKRPYSHRTACSSSVRVPSRSGPMWPNCLRCALRTGSSSLARTAKPSFVIRDITVRRSVVSRRREINFRFSSRSRRRVTSGSRVIIRLAISPQGKPSRAPRKIRSTLYWVGERSSALRTLTSPRDNLSAVRSRSKNAVSSQQVTGRARFPDFTILIHVSILFVLTNTVNTSYAGVRQRPVTKPTPLA